MKLIQGLFWEKKQKLFKVVPTDIEACNPLMHQPTDAPGKKLSGLLLKQLHHRNLDIFI
jgi:hypothetical protein